MKARIRATGDIYNVIDMNDYRNRFQLEDNNWYTMGEIELIEGNEPDWQHYRIKAAIAAMQGMLANPEHHKTQVESGVPCSYFYTVNAVMCADDLIAELQKKGGQDDSNVHKN